jgi:hypothetical protein
MNDYEKNRCKELGNFLMTRRNKIPPSQVGLSEGTRRRTPGLRREEVALLAGTSLTWYTWLEQGRSINVSDQLLESLSRVLQLSKEERNYLFLLAAKSLPGDYCPKTNLITPVLQNVLDSLNSIPSYIMDDRWNVIAWNQCACNVFADFGKIDPSERNIVWMMFHKEDYMDLFDDWTYHAKGILARFRAAYGKHIEDDWFITFIERIKTKSPEFNQWWEDYEINEMSSVIKKITHPIVGSMVFEFSSFDVSDNKNLKLILHNPLAGTDTKQKVMLLSE